jgi:hypothetical protein
LEHKAMSHAEIAGVDAWNALVRSASSRWSEGIARFGEEVALVTHESKFSISATDSFFCIGSCFARNVEEYLIYAGRHVLSKRIICPVEEWPHRPNGLVNKFTTHSIVNELEWVANRPAIDESLFEEGRHGWIDLQLCPGVRPVTLERAIERRTYLGYDYFPRIKAADIVVLTLGLNEVWRDGLTGRYLNATPSLASVRREPQRYTLEISDAMANLEQLEKLHYLLDAFNPTARMIVTVSPVPLSETFSGKDAAVANIHSKATLRVAAEEFSRRHKNVDYFPSFDMIALSPRNSVYGRDCLHVSDRAVGVIIREFLRVYSATAIMLEPFDETAYLAANPDVMEAVRRGELESGFEHWRDRGKADGRALRPS